MRARWVGAMVVMVGGSLFVCALAFLPYYDYGRLGFVITPSGNLHEPTIWDLANPRLAIVLTVVAVVAIALAAVSLLNTARIFPVLATGCSFYLLGQIFRISMATYMRQGAGFWLATGAAAAMSIGGVIASVAPQANAS